MFLMDRFFDGTFLTFGIEVISFAERDQEDRIDPMVYIFPRMTKCTFHTYGPSGTIQNHDALCVLPINILNEKIYFMAWFMLFGLCIFTLIHHIVAAIIILTPPLRKKILAWYMFKNRRDLHR